MNPVMAPNAIDYYDANAASYAKRTLDLDVQQALERLSSQLRPGAHILDAGCGAGRDSKAFRDAGFRVTAMDASVELAGLASAFTGHPVKVRRFDQLDEEAQYDGILAHASLLHLADDELMDAMRRLLKALKPDGALLVSFKYGYGLRIEQGTGRLFNDFDEQRLQAMVQSCGAKLQRCWLDEDVLGRDNRWLYARVVHA